MTSQEKALLVLKTSDLTFGQTSSVGSANATGTQCTWNNINLRVLLGNLYDKYDRFNLCLNTFTTGPLTGVIPDADTGTYISLSGLPFVNNSYVSKTNSLSSEAILGSVLWKPPSTIAATTSQALTPFLGSISLTSLIVSPNNNGPMLSFTGSTTGSSTTLTITGSVAIPIGSYIVGLGIVGLVTITARTTLTNYTMSSAQTIGANTPISSIFPNNVSLPVGATITGNGITPGTTITAQTGPYDYTVNNSQNIALSPMLATVTNTITAASTTTYCNDIKYYENSRVTFTKNQDVCNLTLNIKKVSNDALPTTTYPNMILIFDIYGCDEYRVDDVTNSRILK